MIAIPGLRIEPVNEAAGRFDRLFAAAFESWKELFVVDQYAIRYSGGGAIEDPRAELLERYGIGLHRICPEMALAVSRGSAIAHWAGGLAPGQWRTILFFTQPPDCEVVEYYYYMGKRDLARGKWPPGLRDVVQCIGGDYWEIHSKDPRLLDAIAARHLSDPEIEVTQIEGAP